MTQPNLTARNTIAGLVSGVCLAIPLFSAGISAAQQPNASPSTQTSPSLNPCPSIYYQEPFNSTRVVPQGCPANAATLNQQQGSQPYNSPGASSSSSSSPYPNATSAQPAGTTTASASQNPCPSIYYEEPFNSTRAVPQGCPANAATQNQNQSGTSQ
jgi:hypothetical protein